MEPPANWDELKQAASKLAGGDRFGLTASAINSEEGTFQWLPFLWQSGEDIPTLDSEGGREALRLWADMVEGGSMSRGILSWSQEDVKNEFVNRRSAMMVNGSWQIPVIRADYPDLNWNVIKLPEGKESTTILGGENMAITTACQNPDAAWDLLTWQQDPENLIPYLKKSGRQPSRRDLVALTLILATPAAYALARRRLRFTAAVVFLLLLAQMVPTIIIAGPLFVIFGQIGLIDSYLASSWPTPP